MPTTTNYALRYPASTDPADVPTDMQHLASDVDTALGPKTTTSPISGGPPASPANGDIWIATAVDASGIRWAFQYNAGSGSAYKWEFIGGAPVFVYAGPDESTASASSVELTTQARFTLTRGGDYNIGFGARTYNVTGGAVTRQYLDLLAGGNQTTIVVTAPAANYYIATCRQHRISSVAAGDLLLQRYSADTGTGHWAERFMNILPARVA